jgi:hypothetical protein
MEPRAVKKVSLVLDKERYMLIDWNAMYLVEERLTQRRNSKEWVSWQTLGDVTKLSIADMRTVIWAALIHEDNALKEHDVGSFVHSGNMDYVCEKLAEAFNQSGDEDEKEEGKKENGADPLEEAGG